MQHHLTQQRLWTVVSLIAIGLLYSSLVCAEQPSARQLTVQQAPIAGLQPPTSNVQIDVWSNRADGQYLPGEHLKLYIRPSTDVQIAILNVNALGATTVLFPNAFSPDNRLRANTVYTIPGDSNYQLKVGEPFGTNLIKVVASTRSNPLDVTGFRQDGAFAQYDGSTQQLGRSVQLVMEQQSSQTDWAVADLSFDVVRQRADAGQPTTGFGLQLRLDQPTYRVGERLGMMVRAERDCTLTLVNVGMQQHQATVLYPNQAVPQIRLRAGHETRLPGANSPVQLAVLGPAGTQTLMAMCNADDTPLLADLSMYAAHPDPQRSVHPVLTHDQWSGLQGSAQQRPQTAQTSVSYQVMP